MADADLTRRMPSGGSRLAQQVLLCVLLAQPLLHMLTKITVNRVFLYVAMLLPPLGLGFVAFQRGRFPASRQAVFVFLALYALLLVAASVLSADPKVSISILTTKYSAASSLILAWLGTRSIRDVRSLLRAILLVGSISAIYSIWQQTLGFPSFETDWAWSLGNVHGVDIFVDDPRRATGIAIYSATNSLLLAQCLILLIALPTSSPLMRLQRWAWILAFGIALLFSQTRGIWLAAVAGIIVILGTKRSLAGKSLLGLVPAFAAQVILVLIAYFANPVVHARINSFQGMFTNPNHPFLFRILSAWIPTLQSHPPNLLGYGPGAAEVLDNMFLQALTSTGIVGAAIFLALHVSLWTASYRRARTALTSSPWLSAFFVGFSGVVATQLVAYITGDYLFLSPANVVFWSLAGVTLVRFDSAQPSPCG